MPDTVKTGQALHSNPSVMLNLFIIYLTKLSVDDNV
jgi:hypothetical protein